MNRIPLVLLSLTIPAAGCTWGLKHPDMQVACAVQLQDLSAEARAPTDHVSLTDTASLRSRFPMGIAVARLTKLWDEHSTVERMQILPFKPYEAPYWIELFDGTPEIRSVFTIHEKSVRDEWVTIADLLRAADVMNAGLLLVYGYDNSSNPDICVVSGLLYEIPSGRQLAIISHTATLDEAWAAAHKLRENMQPETDEDWSFFVDHVGFRSFERHFKRIIWTLIDRDREAEELLYAVLPPTSRLVR